MCPWHLVYISGELGWSRACPLPEQGGLPSPCSVWLSAGQSYAEDSLGIRSFTALAHLFKHENEHTVTLAPFTLEGARLR